MGGESGMAAKRWEKAGRMSSTADVCGKAGRAPLGVPDAPHALWERSGASPLGKSELEPAWLLLPSVSQLDYQAIWKLCVCLK